MQHFIGCFFHFAQRIAKSKSLKWWKGTPSSETQTEGERRKNMDVCLEVVCLKSLLLHVRLPFLWIINAENQGRMMSFIRKKANKESRRVEGGAGVVCFFLLKKKSCFFIYWFLRSKNIFWKLQNMSVVVNTGLQKYALM